jgi:small subunit ribosomal protein S20
VASHKSAEKRARQTIKRTIRNTGLRSRMRNAVRAFGAAIVAADPQQIDAAFNLATRQIRMAASKNVLHKCTASRHVSRLAKARHKALTKVAA